MAITYLNRCEVFVIHEEEKNNKQFISQKLSYQFMNILLFNCLETLGYLETSQIEKGLQIF